MTARIKQWEDALTAVVLAHLHLPFAWGSNDCVTFACAAIEAMTGTDPIADLRGADGLPWHDAASAARVIAQLGGLPAAIESRGFVPVSPMLAQRGDLVLMRTEDGHDALTICIGPRLAGPAPGGLAMMMLERGVQAWRV